MGKLEQMVQASKMFDEKLEAKALELEYVDPAKAKAIRESALFYVRQRTTDLLTQLGGQRAGLSGARSRQEEQCRADEGRRPRRDDHRRRAAHRDHRRRSDDRPEAGARAGQALNSTTAGIIDRTGELLKTQSIAIHEGAASSTIPVETLQRAFQNIYQTMDAIDTFKVKALESMKTTVDTLSVEVDKSRAYVARAQGQAEGALENRGALPAIDVVS